MSEKLFCFFNIKKKKNLIKISENVFNKLKTINIMFGQTRFIEHFWYIIVIKVFSLLMSKLARC